MAVIVAESLALHVGRRVLLDGLCLQADKGEFIAVLGANGVGKTTLLRALAGLHPLRSGSLRINGKDSTRMNSMERAKQVAFMTSDDVAMESLRVRDVVANGRYPYHRWWEWSASRADEEAIDAALEAVHLRALAQRDIQTLSSGERQRCWLALGLAQGATTLLLDEPTSHLDIRFAQQILGLLRGISERGNTVIAVLHDPNEAAAYADKIVLLGSGTSLAFGTPPDVLTAEMLQRTYGTPLEIVETQCGLRVITPGLAPKPTVQR